MSVSIIGTGNVGSALGGSLSRVGHNVTSYSRSTAGNVRDAVADADVIILAVPYAAAADVAREIAPAAQGKIVVDTTNPLNATYSGLETKSGEPAAVEIASILTGAHVVKAFNTVFAAVQADPGAKTQTPDALFATDDDETRATFATLAESIGFRPVYVGPLSAAGELEALGFLNIRIQMVNGGSWDSVIALVDAPANALAPAA